eukprot:scaffold49320_cov20-Tisochrysis_lutea.AAC.1
MGMKENTEQALGQHTGLGPNAAHVSGVPNGGLDLGNGAGGGSQASVKQGPQSDGGPCFCLQQGHHLQT